MRFNWILQKLALVGISHRLWKTNETIFTFFLKGEPDWSNFQYAKFDQKIDLTNQKSEMEENKSIVMATFQLAN